MGSQLCDRPLPEHGVVIITYQRRTMHLCPDCAEKAVRGIRQETRERAEA